jgi:hypothetical protein
MLWLTVIALSLALLSACGWLWSFLDSSQRPKRSELRELLDQYAETVLKEYARQFKALETEWDDMYQKFSRLTGRMDRQRALREGVEPRPRPEVEPEQPTLTHSDIMRRWRSK